ncbi:protein THEMIS isoform X2 [Brachyhypopomus gauderio]|uniref:protein THEMIS isoform X2 n=1 Tax=Brachyhypopomus gauderio TaxID=698409 RepID=UPI0040423DD2
MAKTLTEFTRSLDPTTLPRILQIQSGFYCQGAVYELFGQECCLVTGDLMKIIGISITRFTAHTSDGREINLPLDYPGLFRIVADSQPYRTIQEITDSLKISSHRLAQPAFFTSTRIQLSEDFVKEGESFQIKSVTLDTDSGGYVDCELLHREPKLSFRLQLSQQGWFTECDDDQFYTLRELAQWKIPKGRTRMVTVATTLPTKDLLFSSLLENVCVQLTLTPVYELQAVMHLRKSVVLIPSNLDVEVMDMTEQFDVNSFIQPLSLLDVFQKPAELFPIVAEVIEKPVVDWHMPEELQHLLYSSHIVIHQAYEARRVLATEIRQESPRHFLIPTSYKGRLKRRPREFPTAYDLERACSDTEQLHVVATRAFDSAEDGLAAVLARDEFIVKRNKCGEVLVQRDNVGEAVDALSCLRIRRKSRELVQIPMCQDGGFMEVIHDKRQYSIVEVCHWFPLPFNVKVSVRDLSLKEDILAGGPGLRIEEEITEPYLLISTLDLTSCWEVAVKRTHMSVHVEKAWSGGTPTCGVSSAIEDISEYCYYTMRRYAVTMVTPPPRPPKKPREPSARPARPKKPEPKKPEPSRPEPTGTEPTRSEHMGSEHTASEPTRMEPTKPEPTGSEPTGSEHTGSEHTRSEPTRIEPTRPEPTRTVPTRKEPTRPEHTRPDKPPIAPPRCSPKNPHPTLISRESSTDRTTSPTVNKRTIPMRPASVALEKAIPRGSSLEELCVATPDDDDPHDYEYIDDDELENIRRQCQGQTMSHSTKAKPSNTI